MYWYYVYEWRRYDEDKWNRTMDVFEGSFSDLILNATKQPEEWVVYSAHEISAEDYAKLDGHIG